ncbi:MAG TPA: SUMF1/EgtB/PvdO family nonheme iron enzyme [Polyangia bacterium]|jgi:formylglycine-generating enzyme required for sulfatase activity|nr:SUMF1/EgtB/PvdO family nonheme iron enzyme [Polyangia bacterium]
MRAGGLALACLPLALFGSGCRSVLGIEDLTARSDASAGDPGDRDGEVDSQTSAGSPSCRALAPICGPNGHYDCCETLAVPSGNFFRSNDSASPATVTTFWLDKYEFTVGRMRRFVELGLATQEHPPAAGLGAHARALDSGWNPDWNQFLPRDTTALKGELLCSDSTQTFTEVASGNESRPVACLSWYVAFAVCALDGGRLPTEAEWNFAAAGGTSQRPYPWGTDPPDNTRAAFRCIGDGTEGCAITDVFPVGSHPLGNGLWGHSDLAGNISEWTRDAYDFYASPCEDCSDLRDGVAVGRIMRGGDYGTTDSTELRTDFRAHSGPTASARNTGVRCARDMAP